MNFWLATWPLLSLEMWSIPTNQPELLCYKLQQLGGSWCERSFQLCAFLGLMAKCSYIIQFKTGYKHLSLKISTAFMA